MDKQNQHLAQQQKEVNAQTKKNEDELINLRRIRDYLDNQARLRIQALANAENKTIKAHQAKIDRINELYQKSEKMQTYLDMEGIMDLITK